VWQDTRGIFKVQLLLQQTIDAEDVLEIVLFATQLVFAQLTKEIQNF